MQCFLFEQHCDTTNRKALFQKEGIVRESPLTGGLRLMLAEYKMDTVVEVILQTYHIICFHDNEQLWIASTIHDHGK